MSKHSNRVGGYGQQRGFSLVELMVVIIVLAILVAVTVVVYRGMQRRAGVSTVEKALSDMKKAVVLEELRQQRVPTALPESAQPQEGVLMDYVVLENIHYSNLSPVQNGVSFQSICETLIQDPYYSQIHARTGGGAESVVMECDDNISSNSLLITGWDSKQWSTPVSRATLQAYIDSVPYDNWWTDKQEVVQGFYTALISRFETQGGTWPITSFWDPWSNPWAGVEKENLPAPDPALSLQRYCIGASHETYTDIQYKVTSDNPTIRRGTCGEA